MKHTFTLVAALLVAALAMAQDAPPPVTAHPFMGITVGAMPRAYAGPLVEPNAGVEVESPNSYTRVTVRAGYAPKIDTHDGYDIGVEALAFYGRAHALFGGGVAYSRQTTSTYTKAATRPALGAVLRYPQATMILRAVLPLGDRSNALWGPKATLLIPVAKHLRIRGDLGFYNIHPSYQPTEPRTWLAEVAGGLEWRF